MNDAQKKAWDCLNEIERQSLFLQLSESKSSWEAGEILKLSHYKYLEIRERSEKFFRLFSDFFELHTSIFRPDCPCERSFCDFIEGCIEKRLTRKEASLYTGDSSNLLSKVSNSNIERNMKRLKESEDPWDLDSMRLILEFDRWNNFRILPRMLQQPSAFKRRLNKKDKIYIKYLLNRVPEWMHTKLKERFRYKVKPGKKKYWVCLISEELYTDGYLWWKYLVKYEIEPVETTDGRVLVNQKMIDKSVGGTTIVVTLMRLSQDIDEVPGVQFRRQRIDEYTEEIGIMGSLRGLLFRTIDKKERTLYVKKADKLLMVTMTASSNDPGVEEEFQDLLKTIEWK